MKKILSIILSITMVLCMIPVATGIAFADTPTGERIEVIYSQTEFTYDGASHTPIMSVVYYDSEGNAIPLQSNNFQIDWPTNFESDRTNAGTYAGIVTLSEEYTGKTVYVKKGNEDYMQTTSVSYDIKPLDLTGYTAFVTGKVPAAYNDGQSHKELLNQTTFKKTGSSDITGNRYADDITAIVNAGKIDYSGNGNVILNISSSSITFQKSIATATMTYNPVFNGTAFKSIDKTILTVTDSDGAVVASDDYKLEYPQADYTTAGAKTVKVVPNNSNLTGYAEATFTIGKANAKGSSLIKVSDVSGAIEQNVDVNSTVSSVTLKVEQNINGTWSTINSSDYELKVGKSAEKGTQKGLINIHFKDSAKNFTGDYENVPVDVVGSDATVLKAENTSITFTASNLIQNFNGAVKNVPATVKYNNYTTLGTSDFTFYFTKQGENVKVNPRDVGKYDIYFVAQGTKYKNETSGVGFKVEGKTLEIKPIQLSDTAIAGTTNTITYISTSVVPTTPTIDLYVSSTANQLIKNSDYIVDSKWYNASKVAISGKPSTTGTYYVKVSAGNNGNILDSSNAGRYFAVTIGETSIANATITLKSPYYFNSSTSANKYSTYGYKLPNDMFVVKSKSGETLKLGTDYTIDNYKKADTSNSYTVYLPDTGLYIATIKGIGNYTGTTTAAITVGTAQTDLSSCKVTVSPASSKYTGSTVTAPTVTITYGTSSYYKYTLTSRDCTLGTWKGPSGVTVFKNQGSYTATISPASGSTFKGSTTATFTIGSTTALTESSVTVTGYTTEYKLSGTETKKYISNPASGMKIYKGTAISSNLITDYTTSIVDGNTSSAKAVSGYYYTPGTYYIKITFTGAYSGTIYKPFKVVGNPNTIICYDDTITVRALTDDEVRIDASCLKGKLTFDSSNPSVAEVISGGYVYLSGKVGTAKITITSPTQDGYSSETKYVYINAKPSKAVFKTVTSPKKGQAKFTVKKQDGVERYQIRYSYKSKDVSENYGQTYIDNNTKYKSTQSKTIKKSSYIKSGKTLYVKVRCIYTKADGSKGYGVWSNVKKVTVK